MAEALPPDANLQDQEQGQKSEYYSQDTSKIDLENRQRLKRTFDSYASEIIFLVRAMDSCLKMYKPVPFGVTKRVVMPLEKFLVLDRILDESMGCLSKCAHIFDGLFRFRIGIGGSTPDFSDISQRIINAKYLPTHKQTWLCEDGANIFHIQTSTSFKCKECKYGQCYFFLYEVFSDRIRTLAMRLSRLIGSYRMIGMYVMEVPNLRSMKRGGYGGYEEGYNPYADRYGAGYVPPYQGMSYGGYGNYGYEVMPRFLFKGSDAEYQRYIAAMPQRPKPKKKVATDSGFVAGMPSSIEEGDDENE